MVLELPAKNYLGKNTVQMRVTSSIVRGSFYGCSGRGVCDLNYGHSVRVVN